jgi:hypothetical protein
MTTRGNIVTAGVNAATAAMDYSHVFTQSKPGMEML